MRWRAGETVVGAVDGVPGAHAAALDYLVFGLV